MRRQLLRHFPHLALWFGSPEDPAGSLQGRNTPHRLIAYRDIFAPASYSPLPMGKVANLLASKPLPPEGIMGKASLHLRSPPEKAFCNENLNLTVEVKNQSGCPFVSLPPHPVRLSYHWLNKDTGVISCLRRSPYAHTPPTVSRSFRGIPAPPSKPGAWQCKPPRKCLHLVGISNYLWGCPS